MMKEGEQGERERETEVERRVINNSDVDSRLVHFEVCVTGNGKERDVTD